jgi:alpha-tubulin suppressor-like RCC1 family protein
MRRYNSLLGTIPYLVFLLSCGKAPEGAGASGANTPTKAQEALKAVQVAADQKTSYALMSDGTVRAWGNNDNNALGDGRKGIDAATPVAVKGLAGVTAIEAGSNTGAQIACAILSDASVSCWGGASYPSPYGTLLAAPTNIPELKGAKQISLGTNGHGCAAMADGTAKCWGSDAFGIQGNGSGQKDAAAPEVVPGLKDVEEIRAGYNHTCARLKSGDVFCWGYNSSGEVDPKNSGQKEIPTDTGVKGASQLIASSNSCAITGESVSCWGSSFYEGPKVVPGVDKPKQISGKSDVICILEASGKVKCMGDNRYGQLGNGDTKTSYTFVEVSGLSNATSISVGEKHSCAATTEGKVFCWGYNQRGELGDGSIRDSSTPVEVKNITSRELPAAEDGLGFVKEYKELQSFEGLPQGCTYQEKLAFATPNSKLTSFNLKSGYALRNTNSLEMRLANYQQDPKNLFWDEPRGEQVRYSLSFYRVDLQSKSRELKPIDLGVYDLDTKNERYLLPSVVTRADSYMIANLSLQGVSGGSVKLTYIGDDWICGELNVKADKDTLTGPFVAKVIKQ